MAQVKVKCIVCGRIFTEALASGDEKPGRCPSCADVHLAGQMYWPYGSKELWDKAMSETHH